MVCTKKAGLTWCELPLVKYCCIIANVAHVHYAKDPLVDSALVYSSAPQLHI